MELIRVVGDDSRRARMRYANSSIEMAFLMDSTKRVRFSQSADRAARYRDQTMPALFLHDGTVLLTQVTQIMDAG
jgi:hypothetical protein